MPSSRNVIAVLSLIVIGAIIFGFFNLRDNRTGAERMGDAISEMPNGMDKAVEQLEDRSPAQRAADAVKGAVER